MRSGGRGSVPNKMHVHGVEAGKPLTWGNGIISPPKGWQGGDVFFRPTRQTPGGPSKLRNAKITADLGNIHHYLACKGKQMNGNSGGKEVSFTVVTRGNWRGEMYEGDHLIAVDQKGRGGS